MKLENAVLNSIALQTGATKEGDPTFASPTVLDGVRCALGDPSFLRRQKIMAAELTATAILIVFKSALPAGIGPADNARVVVTIDKGSAQTWRIERVIDQQKTGGLAHYECFVREL